MSCSYRYVVNKLGTVGAQKSTIICNFRATYVYTMLIDLIFIPITIWSYMHPAYVGIMYQIRNVYET